MICGEKSRKTAEVRKSKDGQKEHETEYEEKHGEAGEAALECYSI